MLTLIGFAALIGFGVWVDRRTDHAFGFVSVAVGSLGLGICLITIPINQLETGARIMEVEAFRATTEAARASEDGFEGAAFRAEVTEWNQWIARAQYWADGPFALWWPSEVRDLEPIR